MTIEKNIEKQKKQQPPAALVIESIAEINHRDNVDQQIDEALNDLLSGDEIPTYYQTKTFFIHLNSIESGEMVYCVVEGRCLTEFQYKILFAIQMQVEISLKGKDKVLERYVSSWFFEPTHVQRLKKEFENERDITWDGVNAGCFFPFHADLPDPSGLYAVVDGEY